MRPRYNLLHLHYDPAYEALWSSDNHLLFDVTDVTIFVIGRDQAISVWHISDEMMVESAKRCEKGWLRQRSCQQEYSHPVRLWAAGAYHGPTSERRFDSSVVTNAAGRDCVAS
jgi:hypothetical protein